MSARWTSSLLSVLRVVAGFLFVAHGTQKLFNFPAAMPGGAPELTSLMGIAGMIEFAGGTLMIAGLLTRPVAFVLAGEMAAAYFTAHAAQGFWPLVNGGELAVLYCFTFLFFAAAGGGRWSLDAIIARERNRAMTPAPTSPRFDEREPAPPYRRAS